jgi:16S rRNA (adenine1518-N6/adenine1519-N6)-dimethyltransferase
VSGYRPKKRLGQNFLTSTDAIRRIIDTIDPQSDMTIVEIGAGRGALTLPLAASGADITAVEIDRDLIGYLNKLLDSYPKTAVLNDDFLHLDPLRLKAQPFVLVGNLPYQITTPVIEWIVRFRSDIRFACLMMQKEVADRLASSPGSKDWSPLAIFTQLYFDIERCFTVARDCFHPPPQVTSAVVKMIPRPATQVEYPEPFERVVRASFQQRRKLLVNNLAPGLVADAGRLRAILAELDLPTNIRAEQVSTDQFLDLTGRLVAQELI